MPGGKNVGSGCVSEMEVFVCFFVEGAYDGEYCIGVAADCLKAIEVCKEYERRNDQRPLHDTRWERSGPGYGFNGAPEEVWTIDPNGNRYDTYRIEKHTVKS